jgi:hypothetical protein
VRRSVLGLVVALAFLTLIACPGRADDEQYAYLTGVYWFDGELYHVDVTCWNLPGNPEGGLVEGFKANPGGGYAGEEGAPSGWYWSVSPHYLVAFTLERDYMIQPGGSLSGFRFAADFDPGDVVYWYGISMDEGPSSYGYFTPEYIPEPWLAGPLTLTALAAWRILCRRR